MLQKERRVFVRECFFLRKGWQVAEIRGIGCIGVQVASQGHGVLSWVSLGVGSGEQRWPELVETREWKWEWKWKSRVWVWRLSSCP